MLTSGKKISVIAGGICGIILVAVWVGAYFLESDASKKKLLNFFNETIPGRVSFEKLDIHIFSGQVDLAGLQIQGPDKRSLVSIKRIKVNLSLLKLLAGELFLSSVLMDSPEFDLSMVEDGSLNLLSAFVPSGPSPSEPSENASTELPLNILINEFIITSGTLAFSMPENNLNLLVSGMDILISDFNLLKESARLRAKFQTGKITTQGRSIVINSSRLQTNFKAGDLSDVAIQTGTSGLDLKIHGSIKNIFMDPFMDIFMGSRVALEQAALLTGMEEPSLKGVVRVDLSVKGGLENPEVKVDIHSEEAGFREYSVQNLTLQCMMKDWLVTMGPSGFSSKPGNLSLAGVINLGSVFPNGLLEPFDLNEISYDLNAALDEVQLSALPKAEFQKKGLLTSLVNFQGKGFDPEKMKAEITAELTAEEFRFQGMPEAIDANIQANIGVDKSMAGIRSVRLTAPGIVLTGHGSMDIPAMEISGHLDLEVADFGLLDRLTRLKGRGNIKVSADIDGPFSNPTVSLSALASNMGINNIFLESLVLNTGLDNGVLDIERFQLTQGKSLITGSGQARILDKNFVLISDPDIQLAVSGESVFLEDFFTGLTGRLSLDGQVKGQPSNLDGVLIVDGDSLGFGEQSINSFSSKILIHGQTLEIAKMDIQVLPVPGSMITVKEQVGPMDQTFELKNRRLGIKGHPGPTMEGVYHLDTKAFSVALDMDGLNLSPYFKLMGRPQLTGAITGRVRAEGQADQLDQISASAGFSKIMVAFADKPFIRVKDADLAFENRRLRLFPARIELLEKGSLMIKGQGDLGGSLDFEARGEVPLEVINPLVKEVEFAQGLIRISASLKGSIAAPRIYGDLRFNGLGMGVDVLEQDFKNIEGHIKLSPDKIEILGFKGYLDQGRFDLGGSVGLKEWAAKTIDLKFNALQLNLDIPDLMDLEFNCNLKFSGTDQASELTGEIILLEGRYYKDVELDLIATATQKTRKIKPLGEKKSPGFLQTIGLNVHISRREPLLVDNNLAYLEVNPDLTIQGTAATPILAGRAQVDSGRIHFKRAEFEVKKGVIDFVNPYKIEPTIDIKGEMEIRAWTITLTISGTPDNLDLKFSSNPSEQHADILSLIAFGKTTRELRAADDGGRFAPEEIFAKMVADSLQKSLKDATGVDYLEINMDDKDESGSPRVNVTVGTDLSRQISVKYGVDVRNGETVQRVTTYYKLLENLLMSGYQDTGGKFGGELKYRLEFR